MRKKGKAIMLGILFFLLAFGAGAVSKVVLKPAWSKSYMVKWSDELGTLQQDLSYGEGKANAFDLYLPKETGKDSYGLVVYLHAGGFRMGDKVDDRDTLAWLTSKGYVAAGINYTLATDDNGISVYDQSQEIKAAIPKVVEAAKAAGYPVDKMAIAGGSAGHALAMIYSYRDGKEAPVPLVFTYGAVGPSSFYVEDWGIFGLDQDTDQSRQAGAALFSFMSGQAITPSEIADGTYLDKVKVISAADWVSHNPVPTVAAYGAHDRMQPFLASKRLEKALIDTGVDHQYFVLPHSGHGIQNDDAIVQDYMEAVEEYLAKYLPVK